MSDSVRPHRWQPTRLYHPWDSPGKNTGVGCHFLLQCMKVKSEREVAQLCPTLSDPMDCSLPGSCVHGIAKSRTRLSDFIFPFHFHALEKEMATHSSVLAWRIPGMGESVEGIWNFTQNEQKTITRRKENTSKALS